MTGTPPSLPDPAPPPADDDDAPDSLPGRHVRGPGFDRLDTMRGEADALTPETRAVLISGHRALLRGGAPVTPTWAELAELGLDGEGRDPVLLGEHEGVRYAAVEVPPGGAEALERDTGGRFESLRVAGAARPAWQAGLLFYAAGLLAWHRGAVHCGRCGAPTRTGRAGHVRVCTEEECGAVQFPRTDPAIITLVRRGDRALLGRQPRWDPGLFSTLAGFVEPGESLEEAVAREVNEEVGLAVVRTVYFASQPWPFPHSLMIGFRTWAAEGDLVVGEELEEARWFTRDELRAALSAGEITIPPPLALSRSLIEDWLEE
jgi:NAD+ diphosphatase